MIDFKRVLKAFGILNSSDQTKALEVTVSDSATTNTKTTLVAEQSSNVTVKLPNATTTIVGRDNPETISNKQVQLSNTTDNKLLLSEATSHKIVDSLITHIDNAGDAELTVSNNLKLTAGATKEIILEGKAVRVPTASFPPSSLPSGFLGDVVFNTATDSLWHYTSTGYVELIGGAGANRYLSNLISPTQVNQDLLPDSAGKTLGNGVSRWDASLENADVNSLTVNTDLTVDGVTTINNTVTINGDVSINGTLATINTTVLDVTDANITVNNGGNDVTAEGAGITVERTGTAGSIAYQNSLASKFKVGDLGSESEVLTAATNQTITGQKTIQNLLNLPSVDDSTTNTTLTLSGGAVTRITNNKPTINAITGLSSGSFGLLFNASAGNITFVNQDAGVAAADRILTVTNNDITLLPNQSVIYYRDAVSSRTRLLYVNPTFTEEVMEFKLNGSYYNINDIFPIDAIDGYTVVPYNMIITNVFMYNVKAGDGGATRFKLYKKDFGSATFDNLLTQDPIISFLAGDGVWLGVGDVVPGCTAPILNATSQFIPAKAIIKCDLFQPQSGTTVFPEDCGIVIHYLKL